MGAEDRRGRREKGGKGREEVYRKNTWLLCWTDSWTMGFMANSRSWSAIVEMSLTNEDMKEFERGYWGINRIILLSWSGPWTLEKEVSFMELENGLVCDSLTRFLDLNAQKYLKSV